MEKNFFHKAQLISGSAVIGYVLAVCLVGAATVLRLFLDPHLGDTAVYVTYFLANAVVIRCTGIGPSLVAIGLSTLAVNYLFLTPRFSLFATPAQYFTSGIFLAANLVILALAQAMRTAKAKAEANARTIQEQLNEREAREARLRLQTSTLRAAANAIIITDSQGTIQWVNPAFERLTGYSPAEAIGQNPRLVKSGRQDLAFYKRLWETILAGQVWHGEIVNKRKDGRFYTEEMTITPVRGVQGEITNFIAVKQDVTERKEAEIALRQSEERFRFVVESIPHLVWSARPNGFIEYANPRALGYGRVTLKEVEGGNWMSFLHPDDVERTRQAWEEALASGNEYRIEYRLRGSDGQYRWHLAQALPFRDAEERIIRWYGTCTDIHDRKEAEAALAEAQETLREHAANLEKTVQERTAKLQELVSELEHFSYSITHDMRAPLRAMHGFAEMILRADSKEYADTVSRDFLQRIVTSAARMDALITDALNYTRAIGAGLTIEPVNVATLLKGMLQSYPSFQPPNAEIILEGPLPVVLGNEAALTQCFSNLLDNAVKFVAPGKVPRVRIWAEERKCAAPDQPRMARLWFEDNGIGIAREHHEKIFAMFHRVERIYKGTGIGLALVRKNVERMGGKVGVESELGKGSRFWLDLKLMKG